MVREIVVDVVEGAWDATEFRERATSATMELNNNGLLLALHSIEKEEGKGLEKDEITVELGTIRGSKSRRKSIVLAALAMQSNQEMAAVMIQRCYRTHYTKKKVKAKRHWKTLKEAVLPMMKQRVSDLRGVYDNCGLVDPMDWVAVVEVERTHLAHLSFAQQQGVMFVVPLVALSLWFFIPIGGYETGWQNSHYMWFLVYFFVWLVSACLFFFPLFELVVEIPFRLVVLLSMVFSASLILVHAIIFFARGSNAFWQTCLASSLVHFAITTIGLIEMVGFVVGLVIWKVKKAEELLHGKKDVVLDDIERDALPTPASISDTLSSLAYSPTVDEHFQKSILRHAASDPNLLAAGKKEARLAKASSSIQKGLEIAKTRRNKRRRSSMMHFDIKAKERIEKASHGFVTRKLKQVLWTTLAISWAACFFWCLSIYSAFFVTHANDNFNKVILTGVFHFMTKFFEVTCLLLAEEADVCQLQTYAPGHALEALRADRNYDNYGLWRLSHRMSFALVAYKRSFYVTLFAEATDIASFLSMGFAALGATVCIQMLVTSRRFHNIVSQYLKRRSYESMAREFRLQNAIDGSTTILYFFVFLVFFVIAKNTENAHVYPYLAHSKKNWDTVLFLLLYTVLTVIGCYLTYIYHNKALPQNGGDGIAILFKLEDRKLFLSVTTILLHIGMDPYYSLAVNNMSLELPCGDSNAPPSVAVSNTTL